MISPPETPEGWDRLAEPSAPLPVEPARASSSRPGMVLLLAGATGDLVATVAVCAGGLAGLRALGHAAPLPALPWAATLGLLWWCVAAAATVVVRRGTPGMLMAGFGYAHPLPPRRVAPVLAVALSNAVLLGAPVVLGLAAPLLRWAGGDELAVNDPS
jgi:hypothetical protein